MAKKKRIENLFEFKNIKQETDKAICFIMSGNAELWLPKKNCPVYGNMVKIPKWLQEKIMENSFKKIQRETKQLKLALV